jgi:hypothetical protein
MTGPMSVFGPLRHLVRLSDLVAIGAKRTLRDHGKSVASDPSASRHRCG